jgi:hypothetical protein
MSASTSSGRGPNFNGDVKGHFLIHAVQQKTEREPVAKTGCKVRAREISPSGGCFAGFGHSQTPTLTTSMPASEAKKRPSRDLTSYALSNAARYIIATLRWNA